MKYLDSKGEKTCWQDNNIYQDYNELEIAQYRKPTGSAPPQICKFQARLYTANEHHLNTNNRQEYTCHINIYQTQQTPQLSVNIDKQQHKSSFKKNLRITITLPLLQRKPQYQIRTDTTPKNSPDSQQDICCTKSENRRLLKLQLDYLYLQHQHNLLPNFQNKEVKRKT